MAEFDRGVTYFTTGTACFKVHFPEDKVLCRYCQFCRSEETLKRFWCRLTNEMIYNPYAGLGQKCPIIFEE